jgi:hypothetical protein
MGDMCMEGQPGHRGCEEWLGQLRNLARSTAPHGAWQPLCTSHVTQGPCTATIRQSKLQLPVRVVELRGGMGRCSHERGCPLGTLTESLPVSCVPPRNGRVSAA